MNTARSDTLPIETLLLDAGGVLVFPNWTRVSEILASHGVQVTDAALRGAEARAKRAIDEAYSVATTTDADRGSRYFNLVFEGAGVLDSPAVRAALKDIYAYHTAHNLWEHVPEDVFEALERLGNAGVTLAVASNANGVLHDAFDRIGLTKYFDCICDSWKEGVEKPDARFFQIVLDRAGGKPETTLHVGDLYHVDVVGARSAGLRALLLDPNDLYEGFDVERVRTLGEVADIVGGRP